MRWNKLANFGEMTPFSAVFAPVLAVDATGEDATGEVASGACPDPAFPGSADAEQPATSTQHNPTTQLELRISVPFPNAQQDPRPPTRDN